MNPSPFPPHLTAALGFARDKSRAGKPVHHTYLTEVLEAARRDAIEAGRHDLAEASFYLLEPLRDVASGLMSDALKPDDPKRTWSTAKANAVVSAILAAQEAMDPEGQGLKEDPALQLVVPLLRTRLPEASLGTLRKWRDDFQRRTSRPSVPVGAIRRYERMKADRATFGATSRARREQLMARLREVLATVR